MRLCCLSNLLSLPCSCRQAKVYLESHHLGTESNLELSLMCESEPCFYYLEDIFSPMWTLVDQVSFWATYPTCWWWPFIFLHTNAMTIDILIGQKVKAQEDSKIHKGAFWDSFLQARRVVEVFAEVEVCHIALTSVKEIVHCATVLNFSFSIHCSKALEPLLCLTLLPIVLSRIRIIAFVLFEAYIW